MNSWKYFHDLLSKNNNIISSTANFSQFVYIYISTLNYKIIYMKCSPLETGPKLVVTWCPSFGSWYNICQWHNGALFSPCMSTRRCACLTPAARTPTCFFHSPDADYSDGLLPSLCHPGVMIKCNTSEHYQTVHSITQVRNLTQLVIHPRYSSKFRCPPPPPIESNVKMVKNLMALSTEILW